ncbi:DNA polymerase IV [Nocardioides sp. 503]|uniref:DNA polymerase IV n=1 Tax=Nocardioides sp. 503 TaxID=2508326 RepID=UPI0010705D89|nr:DNA polymerase IV [Nocardioides sp. 503]
MLHVDLDQFVAAVEVLRRPELVGLPVVVGGRGDPTERAVVSTASYEARELGVGSGMPLRLAARKAPDAVFLPVDAAAYDAASAVVMETLRAQRWDGAPVDVEVLGWDEAFVAQHPAEHPAERPDERPGEGEGGGFPRERDQDRRDPVAFAEQLRAAVLEASALHCSVGIGNNKLQAKIATDFGKPRGVYTITDETWFEEMGERPTRALWGIGAKTAKKLAALGIDTVRQLAESDVRVLAAELGPTMGPWYHRLGRGVDSSPVDPQPYVPRAHGREETFQVDLEEWSLVEDAARRLTHRVVADIDAEGRPAARVGIKVRFKPFFTVTRSLTLPAPTNDPEVLGAAAVELLGRVDQDRPVRLLGVRLEMTEPEGGY